MREIIREKINGLNLKEERNKFLTIVSNMVGDIDADKSLLEIWDNLILWAWGHPDCKYNLNKGFCLTGNVGTSKTVTLEAFRRYLDASKNLYYLHKRVSGVRYSHLIRNGKALRTMRMDLVHINDLCAVYESLGVDGTEDRVGLSAYYNYANLAIDDVGTESATHKNWGNSLNVFATIFEMRYAKSNFTHFTTNLSVEQLAKKYGVRVHDRLRESSNIIV